ncbi:response regulator [Zavarzinella formosa]|uniref:response regulator n=1 Tax=Zavarzinella formosa TaxID=360055 RepID=UPI0002D285BA|nr:response regulator [Zavarzinella formosa]
MTTSPNRPAVLVVDDLKDTADSLATVLDMMGYDTRVAYSPRQVGELVRSGFRPDAAVLDIDLGEQSGFDVARDLCAALGRRPMLVALTGYSSMEPRARREGFDHYFLKPAEPRDVAGVLPAAS